MNGNGRNPKMSYILRIIGGGYVAILGAQVATMPFKEETSLPLWAAVSIGILLALVGVIILINGIKGYMYISKHPEEFEEAEEAGTEEETPDEEISAPQPGGSGIMQKTALPEYLRVGEDEEEADEDQE